MDLSIFVDLLLTTSTLTPWVMACALLWYLIACVFDKA